MKKFYVGTNFSGNKTIYAYTVAEAAYKTRALIPDYDDITYVDVYDARHKRYVRYLPNEDFQEMTDEEYEEYLYTD